LVDEAPGAWLASVSEAGSTAAAPTAAPVDVPIAAAAASSAASSTPPAVAVASRPDPYAGDSGSSEETSGWSSGAAASVGGAPWS
jgi:hypothetical protein